MQNKSFTAPDETKNLPKTKLEVINIVGKTLTRITFEPGWKWSVNIKPVAGTDSCQVHHLLYGISGQLKTVMNDGTETEMGPGDVVDIPPGHDAWVVGDAPFVAIDMSDTKSVS